MRTKRTMGTKGPLGRTMRTMQGTKRTMGTKGGTMNGTMGTMGGTMENDESKG